MSKEKRKELKLARRKHRKILKMNKLHRRLDSILDQAKYELRTRGEEVNLLTLHGDKFWGRRLRYAAKNFLDAQKWVARH